ncbi:MAG: HNH endonuclease signature motif containing protein, partial [Trichodesmium sp. St16_bin2-tuft]|nr:HNH endonuclease signature motif containing protein [Trichodesmium sp. St16_bin2-tuft]
VRTEVAQLLKNQKKKFVDCGLNFRPRDLIDVDHIVPKSKGGKNNLNNKQLLHRIAAARKLPTI